jgi:hypothetical protein
MIQWYRSLDHHRFYSICSGLQAIALAIGLLAGGAWTIWLYDRLHQEEKERADLARAQTELEKLRLEHQQQLAKLQRGIGQVQLAVTPLALGRGESCYLQVVAKVQNLGDREIRLEFPETPLRVAAVGAAADGTLEHLPATSAPLNTFALDGSVVALPLASLLPGEASEFPFLVRVPRRGMYMVQFDVPVDTLPGTATEKPWHWAARGYTAGCSGSGGGGSGDPGRVLAAGERNGLELAD